MKAIIDGKSGLVMSISVGAYPSKEEIEARRKRKAKQATGSEVPVYRGLSQATLLAWAKEAGIGRK